MSSNIYVICDCYDIRGYEYKSFINTIKYIKNYVCDINDHICVVIEENAFLNCRRKLSGICDDIYILRIKDNKISNYRYCEIIYDFINKQNCDCIYVPSGIVGRSICAWLSGKLYSGVTADVLSMERKNNDIIYKRATTYNNLMASIVCRSKIQIASIQAPISEDYYTRDYKAKENYININNNENGHIVERSDFYTEKFDMDNIVLGIGRGVGIEDRNKIIEYASKHAIPVVGTKPLIESGVFPYSHQVGQSGKSISCRCYIAIGISGMIQHTVGIMNCKKIISINPDKKAPIHEIADVSIYLKAADVFV